MQRMLPLAVDVQRANEHGDSRANGGSSKR